jgi:hypothetical protein
MGLSRCMVCGVPLGKDAQRIFTCDRRACRERLIRTLELLWKPRMFWKDEEKRRRAMGGRSGKTRRPKPAPPPNDDSA